MAEPSANRDNYQSEAINLAQLGQSYIPPQGTAEVAPEVSEVLAKVPWWAARGLLYIIVLTLVAAGLWAHYSELDIVVTGRGVLAPEGNTRPVQAVGAGLVKYVFVREGDSVERGKPVLQLDATEIRARLVNLRAELSTAQEQLRQLRVTGPVTQALEQETRLGRLQSDIAAAETSLNNTTVLAPTAGVITVLDVKNPGAVVQAGQTVAQLSPADAQLVVDAQVSNQNMAFVEKGRFVKLKFDAFPYQDYGTVDGKIVEISPDARPTKDGGSYYQVIIAPAATSIKARGKVTPLRPGLAVTADIVTEKKTVLEMILAPFREAAAK